MNYKFDVTLSFAGEQRADVEKVAACLKAAGLKVFYDIDERADLWGKDLYVHLSDVYQNQARYCIIFASKEYAEKHWTSHERQNAQARALREKGNEYILPVRFDDTDIPGLPSTIGYLNFRMEGAEGICKAFLQKIGTQRPGPSINAPFVCESSPRALIRSEPLKTVAFPPVVEAVWKTDSAMLLVEPDDPTDGPFLDRLRQQPDHLIVAFLNNAGVGSLMDLEHIAFQGRQRWRIEIKALQSDFSSVTEMGTPGTSAEQFAEIRAKRILLNEKRPERTEDYNKIMREILVQGQGAVIEAKDSSFPVLYQEYGNEPGRFLQIAWITAVMQMKLSNTVVSVERFHLGLNGSVLTVRFRGRRTRKFTNVDPYVIEIDGQLDLRSQEPERLRHIEE